jgi:predicted DNA-binding transcriptional regulator AlpA
MHDVLLNEEQVSRLTSLPKSRLQKDRCIGGSRSIPFVKLGRLVRYRESDVAAWMAEQKAYRSTSEYQRINSARVDARQKEQ